MSRSMLNALAVVGLSSLLLGCTGLPASEPEPHNEPNSVASQPVDEELTTPQDGPIQESTTVIPPCTELVSLQTVQDLLGPLFIYVNDDQKIQDFFTSVMGPAAIDAFNAADVVQTCTWAMEGSDGINALRIAVLPDEAQKDFISALRNSDFNEVAIANGSSFVWNYDPIQRNQSIWYGFHENIVVASLGYSSDGLLGGLILNAIVDANPE